MSIDPALPRLVRTDPHRIRQILLNLWGNASKFTPKGEVRIELRVEASDAAGVRLRCEVRDTGIGIPPDRVPLLFKPFMQVDTSTTRRFGGTGLGLSIVHRLVHMLGGEAGVLSEIGVGSLFWFTFHVQPSAGVLEQPADHLQNTAIAGARVLAIEACRAHSFDIILMDCQMPVLDGYQATRAIREAERHSQRRTPIIAVTAHAMKGASDPCFEAGMDGYLTKPVERVALAEMLGRFLGRS